MQIIDADVHISPDKGATHISAEELIARMDYSGVSKAVTWITPPYLREIDEANKYLYESAKKHPNRILPIGWANPMLGVEKAKDMVKRCIYEYGFYGIKLNGAQNEFYIDNPEISMPVIEEIARTGKAIAFHIGADAYEYTHPFRLAKIARRYPEMPVLAVHMGGAALADLSDACIEFASQCQNIMLVGSSVRDLSIVKAIRALGSRRVCYGSDTPFALMHASVAMYRAILAGEKLSGEEQADTFGNNITRFLHCP
jgi:predicted TIM-barrel fold metal-dependent hydrolase